jgi:flavodoxin
MKTLVVYYSLSGRTELVARTLSGELQTDLVKVEEPKRHSLIYYYVVGGFAALKNKRWEIKPVDFNLAGYEHIFIGSPVWGSSPVPAINTFIAKADLNGKTVTPFVTMGGKNGEGAIQKISDRVMAKGGKIAGMFQIQTGGIKNEEIVAKAKTIAVQFK